MTCAVILAGGAGTRLMEETVSRPKPMVEIGGRPILWHIMKIYAAHGVTDFIVCLGYKGFQIKEYFANYRLHAADVTVNLATGDLTYHRDAAEPWTVTLIDTGDTTQTGGRLQRIDRYLKPGEPFCMTYGDGVGSIDISASLELHRRHGKLATVTAVTPAGRFGALTVVGNQVVEFGEKPPGDGTTINGGFFVLDPSVLERIEGDDTVFEAAPLESLARDGQLVAHHHSGFWMPMDTMRDRAHLEELWASGAAPWKIW